MGDRNGLLRAIREPWAQLMRTSNPAHEDVVCEVKGVKEGSERLACGGRLTGRRALLFPIRNSGITGTLDDAES